MRSGSGTGIKFVSINHCDAPCGSAQFSRTRMYSKRRLILLTALCCSFGALGQPAWKRAAGTLAKHVFTPAIEIGYVMNDSKYLLNGVMFKGAVEYRFINTHGPLLRGNYDTYDAKYQLPRINNTTNIVKGTAFFSDLLLGGGWRVGNLKQRCFALVQGGVKFYDFPNSIQNGSTIDIRLEAKTVFTGRLTIGYEYYLNLRSAFTLEAMHGQVFERVHFWEDRGGSYALSFGFTTALN